MAKPEGVIEDYLCRQAKKYGYLCMKFVSPGTDGVPDRVLIGHGNTFFVETKAPGETPRKLQEATFADMQAHGAKVYVIDTKEGVDQLFTKLKARAPKRSTREKTMKKRQDACRQAATVLLPCMKA